MRNASLANFVAALLILTIPIGSGEASAEGLEPIEYTLGDGTVIRFSGQINMGVLHYDDGQDDFTNFVDNENSSSRARLEIFSNPTTGLEVRIHVRGRVPALGIQRCQPT